MSVIRGDNGPDHDHNGLPPLHRGVRNGRSHRRKSCPRLSSLASGAADRGLRRVARLETSSLLDAPATARLSFVTGRCRLTLTPSSVRRAGEGPGPWFRHSSRHQRGNLNNTPIAVERCGRLLRHRLVARRGIQIRIDRAGLSTWIEEDRLCDRRHLLSIHAVQDGRVLQRNRHA